jgi:bifunctional DNase/RNase
MLNITVFPIMIKTSKNLSRITETTYFFYKRLLIVLLLIGVLIVLGAIMDGFIISSKDSSTFHYKNIKQSIVIAEKGRLLNKQGNFSKAIFLFNRLE